MAQSTGMLTREELSRMVRDGRIDTVQVVFPDLYGRLLGKRMDADFFLNHAIDGGTHACSYLLTVDMEMEPVPGYEFANWEKGYGDLHLVPDLDTLRIVDWLKRTALVICDLADTANHHPIGQAPRSILKTQVSAAAAAGFQVMVGTELEYYIYRNTYRDASLRKYNGLEPAGWYLEDYHMLQGTREEDLHRAVRSHLKRSGIPVESSKGEWGRGQHEINIRFCDALAMADRHTLYKQCIKELADQLESSVTFMAKVDADQAGSSSHIHLSLADAGGNVFGGKEKFGPVRCSPLFRWFLGGWMTHVPELMVLYAPTINSYKRFQAGSWAPTRIAWSYDNRTAGFRVVGRDQSLRIECRIPGADCNPYLAIAAAIASGLDGIARRIEPPAAFEGDQYVAENLPRMPTSLRQARSLFEGSGFVKNTLGEAVHRHYARFYRAEQQAFDSAVTDWERQRYFERI